MGTGARLEYRHWPILSRLRGQEWHLFRVAAKPAVLEYFNFATRKAIDMIKLDQRILDGIWVSSGDRHAILSQSSDYHQDIMLAEPRR